MQRIALIFIIALCTNAIWENLHAFLYIHYKGGEITQFILLRAAVWDAVMISLLALPFLYIHYFRKRSWLIIVFGVVVAVTLEWYALGTGRWAYTELMPVIPLLGTGLTPTIQLGLLGYGALKMCGSEREFLGLEERW